MSILIVASTPSPTLGIGKSLQIPWRLPSELAYFARVTKRIPTPLLPPPIQTAPSHINAVIMGRRTYDSIPTRFRPLPDRINVVISRDAERLQAPTADEVNAYLAYVRSLSREQSTQQQTDEQLNDTIMSPTTPIPPPPPPTPASPPPGLSVMTPCYPKLLYASSLDAAASLLQSLFPSTSATVTKLHKTFIIGGSEIYRLALSLPRDSAVYPSCILQTVILEPTYECDTFFPEIEDGWMKCGVDELVAFTGEEKGVVDGVREEKGVKFEYRMWKR